MKYHRINPEQRSDEEAQRMYALHENMASRIPHMIAEMTNKELGQTTSEDFENVMAMAASKYLATMKDGVKPLDFERLSEEFTRTMIGMMTPFQSREKMLDQVNEMHDRWKEHCS